MKRVSFRLWVILPVVMLTAVAHGADEFDWRMFQDMKEGYFERTYKGKAFSDVGVIDRYDHRSSVFGGAPYVQVRNDKGSAWCVVDGATFTSLQQRFPVDTPVRMTGTLREWYLSDRTLFLEDNCTVGPRSALNATAHMDIIDDLEKGHFERSYKGRAFSDTGTISRYSRRFALFGQGAPYVQVEKDANGVFCEIDESRFATMPNSIPVETHVRIAGTMEEWWRDDMTLRLQRNCSISRQ
jgi:hypothetical protein